MRINTNVSALNSYRNLNETNRAVAGSMEKLSSGFRINKAGDDAAGLGIANRLRADTRALNQAAKNADQANSVLQIAEGATSTIQKMLERMKELATQAGSDSVDTAGRTRIQAEFAELKNEITRTVETTKFQGGHLLQTVAQQAAVTATTIGSATNMTVGGGTATGAATIVGTYNGTSDVTLTVRRNSGDSGYEYSTNGSTWTAFSGSTATVNGMTVDVTGVSGTTAGASWTRSLTAARAEVQASGGNRSFLIGSSEQYGTHDQITINSLDLRLNTLGVDVSMVDTLSNARTALTAIDTAMGRVATALGNIGAAQNRIDYAVTNLKTSIQNFSAAESVIRDLDMAEEMTKFSKNNILAQAGTAMLAQANQSAQGVLQLLRG